MNLCFIVASDNGGNSSKGLPDFNSTFSAADERLHSKTIKKLQDNVKFDSWLISTMTGGMHLNMVLRTECSPSHDV